MSFLTKAVETTKARLEEELRDYHPTADSARGARRRSLVQAIRGCTRVAVIAEIKPASPSRGKIRNIQDSADLGRRMVEGGATGLSVLTEPHFFGGSVDMFNQVRRVVDVPMLMKDFLVDERQIYRAAEVGADVVLLIPSICPSLRGFHELALSLGLEALIEVHNPDDIEAASAVDPRLVGVNHRDLSSLAVDVTLSARLIPLIRRKCPNAVIVSESGVKSPTDVRHLVQCGAEAFLIGTYFMEAEDVTARVKQIVGALG